MKQLLYISLLLLTISCAPETSKLSETKILPDSTTLPETTFAESKPVKIVRDSTLTFQIDINFQHHNIVNHSNRKVDMLYNGVRFYFGGKQDPYINFFSECLSCEPVQEYEEGLLFARRFLILPDKIKYYKKDRVVPKKAAVIQQIRNYEDEENIKIKFSQGKGNIHFIKQSCNDASFQRVTLQYPEGAIVVDSLLDASFFEYDLNKDGRKEQYLMATRNCSWEIMVLRIRNPKDKIHY